MVGRSLACSFATGNSTIVKTAELTPLSATFFAKAIENAGVPNGLVNIICGYGNEAGSYLVSHPDVNHVVFTGSVSTGKKIRDLINGDELTPEVSGSAISARATSQVSASSFRRTARVAAAYSPLDRGSGAESTHRRRAGSQIWGRTAATRQRSDRRASSWPPEKPRAS